MTANYPIKTTELLAATGIRAWMRTLDFRAAYYDRSVEPALSEGGQRIYIFWHEYILFPLHICGHCNMSMLLSRHRDADVLERIGHHLGYESIRGSTYRGGSTAVRALMRKGRSAHLIITPDGPRGPRRHLAQGPIYLASRLGLPIVPSGFGCNRPWRAKSWDRFAIPRPFSRARSVVGPEIFIPPNLDRPGVEHYRQRMEHLLRQMTDEAEAWAEAGTRKVEEVAIRPKAAKRRVTIPLDVVSEDTERPGSRSPALRRLAG